MTGEAALHSSSQGNRRLTLSGRPWPAALTLAVLLGIPASAPAAPRFYPDDPLTVDDDRVDTPKPATVELSLYFDILSNTFHDYGIPGVHEAEDVNTLDEVPDSTWFTNRHGRRPMDLAELLRGPDRGAGPVGTWTVQSGKSTGVTPGFLIKDENGDRYLIKLDRAEAPELNSGAEMIATHLFWALGYNVPENYLAAFDPKTLAFAKDATWKDELGHRHKLDARALHHLLRGVAKLPSGSVRALASRYLDGKPVGPFRYWGVRSDDPNDVVAHELRRALRGMRLFAAWLSHTDSRADNSLDMWVEDGGRHYLRHHLIDFGTCLGAGQIKELTGSPGYSYLIDLEHAGKALPSLGLWVPPERRVKWPEPWLPSVGRLSADHFYPERWRGDYPNPAFERMTDRDGFWAAKILMSFTPEELRAVVKLARYSDPRAEERVYSILRERQLACGRTYLGRLVPIDEFRVEDGRLRFANLAERHGLAEPGTTYHATWSALDGDGTTVTPLGTSGAPSPELVIPPSAPGGYLLAVEIRGEHAAHPQWAGPVTVYLRPQAAGYEVVGIERSPAAAPPRKR